MSLFEWIEKSLGFLCNLVLYIVIVLFYNEEREPRHIQGGVRKESSENNVQSGRGTPNTGEREDTVDFSPTSDLTKSLEKVSEVIYQKFILDWHSPPETLQNQPLYKEINSGLQNVFFNIKSRARPLEEYEIIISVATRLIAHFQKKKKKKVTYRFKTRQEEVDFLRKHTERLLDYWLPESMKRSQPLYVFLTEILSVNVFERTINTFSEPTFINEAILLLNDNPAAQQKKVSGRYDKKNESNMVMGSDNIIYSNSCDYQSDTSIGAEAPGTIKKEKKGLKKMLKGLFTRDKPKTTKSKSAIKFRSLNSDSDSTDGGSYDDNEASDDDNEGSDDGSNVSYDNSEDGNASPISIIDTALQKWRQNNWTAKVSESLVKKEDEYVIFVYDKSAPDPVLWNTKRRNEDFKLIYEKICQKHTDFPKFTNSDAIGGSIRDDSSFFHSIGTTPDKFINELLELIKVFQDTEIVFFFSPFDYEDDVKEILEDLPCSEEEHNSELTTTDDESSGDSSNSGKDHDYPKIAFRSFGEETDEERSNEVEDKKDVSSNLLDTSEQESKSKNDESTIGNESDSKDFYQPDGKSASPNKQKDKSSTSTSSDEGQKGLDVIDQNITQTTEQKEQKLQKTVLNVIYQLVDEVLTGGVISFLHRIGIMKKYSKYILNHIPNMYAEELIIWCLNQVAELLMSEFRPQELTPSELQAKALDVLKNKVQGLVTNCLVKIVLNENNLKASHQALQDQLANKETLYGLLEDLTKIITNDHH
ncbi:uncharacterized protein [Phyllobates terribilis]|uniref:uncharacterized protein isoform X2 n=1 Tax=Phyllobates terribilis TaxID=111132 RepID=UPI003CCB4E8C